MTEPSHRGGHPSGSRAGPDRGHRGGRLRVRRAGAGARRADARRGAPLRRARPDPAGHAQPARAGRGRHRHRQDEDPAAARRAALGARRPGLRGRHQGRPVRSRRTRRGEREDQRPRGVGGPAVDGDRVPGGVLRPRRRGHRHPAARHHDVVRPDPAVEGARAQRHPGVVAGPGVPLRRPGRPAAARPRRPARGRLVPHLRRGQGGPEEPGRPLVGDRRGDPARADRLRGPGRRRVLRRAGVRHQGPAPHQPPTARA